MAVLLLLLAVVVGILVGDLVLENPAAGSATVLNHPISGYSEGQLLAMAAALGFVLGLLVVGAASLRRTRRARRRQLRTAERDLTAQLAELERDNASLRQELAHRDRPLARPAEAATPGELGSAWTASVAERQAGVLRMPVDGPAKPVYEQARRAAHLRSDLDR
jgi:outer membrane murein-binding lipoprotein Lpp